MIIDSHGPVIAEWRRSAESDFDERRGILNNWMLTVSGVGYRDNGTAYKKIVGIFEHKDKKVLEDILAGPLFSHRLVDALDLSPRQSPLF
jgi:hypothetical protein